MISLEQTARMIANLSSPFVHHAVKALASNKVVNHILKGVEAYRIRKIEKLNEILVVSDMNIGDAVIVQSFITSLKAAFPYLKISFIYQRKALPLIRANPYIDQQFPFFRNIGFPSPKDIRILKNTIKKHNFDLIFNFCPYFSYRLFKNSGSIVVYPLRLIMEIIRAYSTDNRPAHLAFQLDRFSHDVAEKIPYDEKASPNFENNLAIPHIFTTKNLQTKAERVMDRLNISAQSKKIFYNPDSSSRYTLIPMKFQVKLLKGLLSQEEHELLLLNCGFTFKGIENQILNEISSSQREKVIVVPKNIGIDVYAALIDNSDIFISADTGPLHIAAAKKYIINSNNSFKNSTAIVGIFGATSAKIYGYDSFSSKYFPSAQNAPSKIFEGCPACKNLTCIDKIFKNCQKIKCFEGLEPEPVVDYVRNYLDQIH